jgi:hypothetical protein
MSELTDLISKIEQTKEVAEQNLHNTDYKTRPGKELSRTVARKDLAEFTNKYKEIIGRRVAKIFLTGTTKDNANKFVELLRKEKLQVIHPMSVYENIAQTVKPRLSSGGLYTTPAFLQLCETCKFLGEHYVIFPRVPPKNVGTDTIIRSDDDLTNIVRTAVRLAYGDTLTRAYINEQVFKEALTTHFSGDTLCVVVSNLTTEERNALAEVLFPEGTTFNVDLEGEEPSRSHALRLYRKISESTTKPAVTTTTAVTEK